ncbi:hypothetical protein [Pantoea latae]|uniref:hypothetical protein n=1 Tax=Pantoea latae TaxID=1964541 RepID=UPI00117DFF6C|nr:hypothetical protein [Pantoea latae]
MASLSGAVPACHRGIKKRRRQKIIFFLSRCIKKKVCGAPAKAEKKALATRGAEEQNRPYSSNFSALNR